jgi:hypothetical protein
MATTITLQKTSKGLLIPRTALGDWDRQELEAVWEEEQIVIRPKATAASGTRPQVRQILREAKLLYEPNWEQPPVVSSEERAELAQKLAGDPPLSEIIINDRQDAKNPVHHA